MFLFQKIEETMMKYSDARHAVGEFIIREQGKVHEYTIGEIAERTFTSKATVVRFAKAMGYDGWKEFMKDYIAEVQYQNSFANDLDYNFPFDDKDDDDMILDKLEKLQVETIRESRKLIDPDILKLATDRIVQAENIVIFAMSPNSYYGSLFARKLCSIGYRAHVAASGETGLNAAALGPKDCAILISYSGNNKSSEVLNKIKILKGNKVPLIGITSGGKNYLREKLDCVFTMVSRERLYTKISNYTTEESLGFILNSLFSCVFARNYQSNKNFKILNSRLLEQGRNTQMKEMQDEEK